MAYPGYGRRIFLGVDDGEAGYIYSSRSGSERNNATPTYPVLYHYFRQNQLVGLVVVVRDLPSLSSVSGRASASTSTIKNTPNGADKGAYFLYIYQGGYPRYPSRTTWDFLLNDGIDSDVPGRLNCLPPPPPAIEVAVSTGIERVCSSKGRLKMLYMLYVYDLGGDFMYPSYRLILIGLDILLGENSTDRLLETSVDHALGKIPR